MTKRKHSDHGEKTMMKDCLREALNRGNSPGLGRPQKAYTEKDLFGDPLDQTPAKSG